MVQGLEGAIVKLRAALRAAAWADHELAAVLVREARDVCDEWLAQVEEVPATRFGEVEYGPEMDGARGLDPGQ